MKGIFLEKFRFPLQLSSKKDSPNLTGILVLALYKCLFYDLMYYVLVLPCSRFLLSGPVFSLHVFKLGASANSSFLVCLKDCPVYKDEDMNHTFAPICLKTPRLSW